MVLLLAFLIGHLFGPMLLGITLVRAKLVPVWVMWVLIIRIPLQALGFQLNIGLTMEIYTYTLLFLASIPIALALLKSARKLYRPVLRHLPVLHRDGSKKRCHRENKTAPGNWSCS